MYNWITFFNNDFQDVKTCGKWSGHLILVWCKLWDNQNKYENLMKNNFSKSWQPESCCNRLAPPASVLSAFLVSDWVYIFIFVSPWTIPLWPSGKVIWTTWRPRDRQIETPEGQNFKISNSKSWNEKKSQTKYQIIGCPENW